MFAIILSSIIIMLASLVGVVSVWKNLGKIIERNLHFLVSFSAGVFLVIVVHLGLEIMEHADKPSSALLWIIAGFLGLWLTFEFLPSFHHHHDKQMDVHKHDRLDARKIIASDALHNIGDGILLATTFATSTLLGVTATISIFIHEIIQEVSEFFVMKEAGYSTKKALSLNFIVSGSILIGSIGGYFLLDKFEMLELPLLGITIGSFLAVVVQDLIPHSVRSASKSHTMRHVLWFALGLILMLAVTLLAPHVE